MLRAGNNGGTAVSALPARANFGKLLRQVADERRPLVMAKQGTPKAVLRLGAPRRPGGGSAQADWRTVPAPGARPPSARGRLGGVRPAWRSLRRTGRDET